MCGAYDQTLLTHPKQLIEAFPGSSLVPTVRYRVFPCNVITQVLDYNLDESEL